MPIWELYNGEAGGRHADIDIIAVHGLNPWNQSDHAYATWQKPEGKDGHLWLRDSFKTEQPNARTALYEYNSSPVFQTGGRDRFMHEANDFLEAVKIWRSKKPARPLIMIGHSLGGILIRQALTHAKDNERFSSIKDNTYALVFFGTPHAGHTKSAKTAFGQAYAKVIKAYSGNSSDDLLLALDKHSIFTDNLTERWRHQIDLYKFVFFWSATDEFVPRDSAVMELPGGRSSTPKLVGNHSDICRFNLADVTDPKAQVDRDNYVIVEGNLIELCQGALATVEKGELAIESSRIPYASRTTFVPDKNAYDDDDQERTLENKEYEIRPKKILSSLRLKAANPRWGNISQAYDGTSKWIWREGSDSGPGFIEWLRGPSGVFWITGKPGAGKSTLMKYICNGTKLTEFLSPCDHPSRLLQASYFFSDKGSPSEKTWSGLLHALLRQLLTKVRTVPKEIEVRYDELQFRSIDDDGKLIWPDHELWEAIRFLLCHQTDFDTVLIFIDGLDEYGGKDYDSRLGGLTTLLAPSLESACVVKICVASRPLDAIDMRQSPTSHGLKVHEWTSKDISRYVIVRLSDTLALPGWDYPERKASVKALIERFTEIIIQRAFGVFIWVTIAVNNLISGLQAGDTHEELAVELGKLPSELEALYDNIFRKIKSIKNEYYTETINYLRIVIMAKHRHKFYFAKLTLFELALAADGVEKSLESLCCTMLLDEKREMAQKLKLRLRSRCRGLLVSEAQALDDNDYDSDYDYDSNLSSVESVTKGTEVFNEQVDLLHLTLHEYLDKRLPLMMSDMDPALIKDPDVCLMGLGLRLLKIEPVTTDSENDMTRSDILEFCLVHVNRAEVSTGRAQTVFLDGLKTYLDKESLVKDYCKESLENYWLNDWRGMHIDMTGWEPDFLCLAIASSLVLYIKENIEELRYLTTQKPHLSYSIYALVGQEFLSASQHLDIDYNVEPWTINLLMIDTLLDHGIIGNNVISQHPGLGIMTDWEVLLYQLHTAYVSLEISQFRAELQDTLVKFMDRGAKPNHLITRLEGRGSGPVPYGTVLHSLLGCWYYAFGPVVLDSSTKHLLREFVKHGGDLTLKDDRGDSIIDLANKYDPSSSLKKFLLEEQKKYLEKPGKKKSRMPVLGKTLVHGSKEKAVPSASTSKANTGKEPSKESPKPRWRA
ncbi:MAG: hypothetical protein M1812_003391 [Candelaria pacifica]|nr:MAG: hypothetical protein M1812_003391 [Candelaria pacifica]